MSVGTSVSCYVWERGVNCHVCRDRCGGNVSFHVC